MAKEILTDCRVEIAGTDLGNKVRAVTIEASAELLESTGFGDTTKTFIVGLKDWSATLEFYHDYADNDLNELLFGWWGTTQTFRVRKADQAISATNPEYQGNVIFERVPLLNGQFGQISGGSITLRGSGALTRAVS